MTIDADLDYLAGVVFVRFLPWSYSPPTTFQTVLFGRESQRTAHTWEMGSYIPTSLGQIHYLEFFCINQNNS